MKVFNTSGSLFTKNKKGEREAVESFEAKVGDCDCGISCCGDKNIISWRSANGKMRTINLDGIYDLLPAAEKTEK